MIEQSLKTRLNTIATTYVQRANENPTLPFVVYLSSSGEQQRTLTGYINYYRLEYEIQAFAKTYAEVKQLVLNIINLFKLLELTSIDNEFYIYTMKYNASTETYIDEIDAYAVTITFNIQYKTI